MQDLPPGARVLDLGAGAALVRRASGREDLRWWMVDRDIACAPALRRWSRAALIGDVHDLVASRGAIRFDAVVLADVLEHVADPPALLALARTWLGPGGRVLVSVPNVAHLWVRVRLALGRFDYAERGILDRDHLRFFTRRSLTAALTKARLVEVRRAVSVVPLDIAAPGAPSLLWRAGQVAQAAGARLRPTLFGYQLLSEGAAP